MLRSPRPLVRPAIDNGVHRHELDPESLNLVQNGEQLCLIAYSTSQLGLAFSSLQNHVRKGIAEAIAERVVTRVAKRRHHAYTHPPADRPVTPARGDTIA